MGKILGKILQVIGAIFLVLIVGIALGVLVGTLIGSQGDSEADDSDGAIAETGARTRVSTGAPDSGPGTKGNAPVESLDIELPESEIIQLAKTATVAGHPGIEFLSAIYRYTAAFVEEDTEFTMGWEIGWNDENAPAEPPTAPGSGTAYLTFILNIHIPDDAEPDGFEDNRILFFFSLDTESNELTPFGGVIWEESDLQIMSAEEAEASIIYFSSGDFSDDF